MKVTFFGIGYVGLVQATVLADAGHEVCCIDVDEARVEALKRGEIPIYEPGLADLVKKNYLEKRLFFTTDVKAGVDFAPLQFIAVGTPPDEDGSADLQYVLQVAETIAVNMDDSKVIVNKSTVPVGTADKVKEVLERRGSSSIKSYVVSNPEFLKEGDAINDCKRPDRIVIGTDSNYAESMLRRLYAPFNRNHEKIIVMGVRSAEMTKYAANCMLATKISFMNEMANITERVGANIEEVRKGIGSDSRIGYSFIYPGIGYGGSCFPKDVQALIRTACDFGYETEILKSVESVNVKQKRKLYEFICEYYSVEQDRSNSLEGKVFALWGLSFKPKTDDMREAPSRVLMELLWEAGAKIQAYDPEAMHEAMRIYGSNDNLKLCSSKELALTGADALVICTEWQSFKSPDFGLIKSQLSEPVIFDGRNLFNSLDLKSLDIDYWPVGLIKKKLY